jgi:hypothetical protein
MMMSQRTKAGNRIAAHAAISLQRMVTRAGRFNPREWWPAE